MLLPAERFPPEQEARFQAQRRAAIAVVNATTFWMVAALILVFSAWDWFVDPFNWREALLWRVTGAALIIASGLLQRRSARVDWAPAIAKVRFAASIIAVTAALAVVNEGFVVGLAGLVAVFFAGPYIAIDRRDYLKLNAIPFLAVALIMWAKDLDRFTVINAWSFLGLALVVGFLLARVFESSNRHAFALEEALSREARTDALTGIDNRRALDERGLAELRRGARNGKPVSVILLDIDHFKRINDNYGHTVGDRVIQAVAHLLQNTLRATDRIGRWGGEEFLVILPETESEEGARLADRLRAGIAAAPILEQPIIKATISLGLASAVSAADADTAWDELLKSADAALYRAKSDGRNRVVVAEQVSND